MKQVRFMIGAALCFSLLAAGCASAAAPTPTPTAAPEKTALLVSGSGTTTSILSALQPAFETSVSEYTLDILPGSGTGGGVTGVVEKTLDLAAMARAPKDSETEQGLQFVQVGSAGVAFFTHPDVDVTSLTEDQVKGIFFGEITNWSEVGGQDLDIIVYVRDEDDSSTGALRSSFFGDTAFPESVAAILTSMRDMLANVQGTPGSIGFGSLPSARANDAEVNILALDDVLPSSADYPVTIVLGLGYLAETQAKVQPLLDWLVSEAGKTALGELDVITTA